MLSLFKNHSRRDVYRSLRDSGLFDEAYYRSRYLASAGSDVDALEHYLTAGRREGRFPNPLFDTGWYLSTYPDVAEAGVDPLYHYFLHGAAEGRDPGPFFSTEAYAEAYLRNDSERWNPLAHYLQHGLPAGWFIPIHYPDGIPQTDGRLDAGRYAAIQEELNEVLCQRSGGQHERRLPDQYENDAAGFEAGAKVTVAGVTGDLDPNSCLSATELLACRRAARLLPASPRITYFAFPWSTLIEALSRNPDRAETLLGELARFRDELMQYRYVITVSGHPETEAHLQTFEEYGITHLFTPYLRANNLAAAHSRAVRLLPFPVVADCDDDLDMEDRPYLFNFPDCMPEQWNALRSRRWAVDRIGLHPDCLTIESYPEYRPDGPCNRSRIVIRNDAAAVLPDDGGRPGESLFSLHADNSTRDVALLWRAVCSRTLPVMLAGGMAKPGEPELRDAAGLSHARWEGEPGGLVARLMELSGDDRALAAGRDALDQLRLLYGRENLIYDVVLLYLQLMQEPSCNDAGRA